MKTYRVYIRRAGKADMIFVDAMSLEQIKWKVMSRFLFASVSKIVEVTYE